MIYLILIFYIKAFDRMFIWIRRLNIYLFMIKCNCNYILLRFIRQTCYDQGQRKNYKLSPTLINSLYLLCYGNEKRQVRPRVVLCSCIFMKTVLLADSLVVSQETNDPLRLAVL